MKKHLYVFLIICTALLGILFFLYQESWLIINLPCQSQHLSKTDTNQSQYHEVPVYVWNNTTLQKETTHILKTEQKTDFVCELINQYLKIYQEINNATEIPKIQTVALSNNNGTLFISFNKNPLNKQNSTFEKLMFISGLVKTIKNIHSFASIHLLVNHQPLQDEHLNFQFPWPINQLDLCKT